MSICPNTNHACRCQPQEGVMCPHGPTPDDWRAAPVAQLDADLPPLPRKQAVYGEEGRFYPAEQVDQALASYVERIRHLERELAERKLSGGIDTPEFVMLEAAYVKALYEYPDAPSQKRADAITAARRALIAYIDGRTAGTAPPKHRDILGICDAYESGIGHGLQRDGHKSGDIFGNPAHGTAYEIGYTEGERRAAAPSTQEGAKP